MERRDFLRAVGLFSATFLSARDAVLTRLGLVTPSAALPAPLPNAVRPPDWPRFMLKSGNGTYWSGDFDDVGGGIRWTKGRISYLHTIPPKRS